MSDENQRFIEELAKGNPADVEKVKTLAEQLAELERAGIISPFRNYSLDRPLGRVTNVRPPGTLANTNRA